MNDSFRPHLRLTALGGAAAVAMGVAVPVASATDSMVTTAEILDTQAKAVIDWTVPRRYEDSWKAYNPLTSTYSRGFVTPTNWGINLDGCRSTSVRAIKGYTFTVARTGTAWKKTVTTASCRLSLPNALPALGAYTVSLQLRTDYGFTQGVSSTVSRSAKLRDYLFVSIGDSLAAGEGNPDEVGDYRVDHWGTGRNSLTPVGLHMLRPVKWKDRPCHRSARSGPAVAAKAFEDANPKTSVTFVSVACSGAEVKHLLTDRYDGIEKDGITVPAQLDAVRAALSPPSTTLAQRPIDAMMISIGINDLGFSDILTACALNPPNHWADDEACVTNTGIAGKLATMAGKYDQLATALQTRMPYIRETYLNDYPSYTFLDGACGLLGLNGIGISAVEGSEMALWGDRLSRVITAAMRKYRGNAHRWNTIPHLSTAFVNHKYTCDSAAWFTTYERSWATQGNKFGTAHPNAAGGREYGRLLAASIAPDQARSYYRKVTVRINSIKAAAVSGSAPWNLSMSNQLFQNDESPVVRYTTVPRNGLWTAVPAEVGTFTTYVYTRPASPRHAVQIYMSLNRVLPIKHTSADGYGAGSREVVHPTGSLAARYTVTVAPPEPVIAP